ncbi:hypothetical protein GCM10027568_13630 [Humibacter soli]
MRPAHESRHVFWQTSASAQTVRRVLQRADTSVRLDAHARRCMRSITGPYPGIQPSRRERCDVGGEQNGLGRRRVRVELCCDRGPRGVRVGAGEGQAAQARPLRLDEGADLGARIAEHDGKVRDVAP